MSKEIEAFNRLALEHDYKTYDEYDNDYTLVESALQRLEQIDNANPSEAMRKLDDISYLVLNEIDDLKNKELWKTYFDTIKQALIKAQEQEKVLKIIKEKNVDIYELQECENVEQYNKKCDYWGIQLTQEEFDLLKGMLG